MVDGSDEGEGHSWLVPDMILSAQPFKLLTFGSAGLPLRVDKSGGALGRVASKGSEQRTVANK